MEQSLEAEQWEAWVVTQIQEQDRFCFFLSSGQRTHPSAARQCLERPDAIVRENTKGQRGAIQEQKGEGKSGVGTAGELGD